MLFLSRKSSRVMKSRLLLIMVTVNTVQAMMSDPHPTFVPRDTKMKRAPMSMSQNRGSTAIMRHSHSHANDSSQDQSPTIRLTHRIVTKTPISEIITVRDFKDTKPEMNSRSYDKKRDKPTERTTIRRVIQRTTYERLEGEPKEHGN